MNQLSVMIKGPLVWLPKKTTCLAYKKDQLSVMPKGPIVCHPKRTTCLVS